MIYTVTLNPALDKTVQIPSFRLGEVNRISAMRTDPGGKGINVSKVLRELGEPSVAAAILGGAAGQKIESALRALGIEGMYLFTEHETRTNLKIVDPTLHTNTDVNEPGAPADEAVLSKLLTQLTDRLRPGDLVVLSGKVPAGAPDTLYRDWILACRAAGAAVYLDAEGELLRQGVTADPALIKPNQAELSGVMGRPHDRRRDDPGRAGARRRVSRVAVTMARAAHFCAEDCVLRCESPRVPVGSTVGAGDSVVAALAYARQRQLSREDTARLAMATGAANVMCSGTQAARLGDIEQLLPQVRVTRL
ncbi:MAG: 1-phosphofructokinase family hexose kinase [Oscillospiraceae bacterium]